MDTESDTTTTPPLGWLPSWLRGKDPRNGVKDGLVGKTARTEEDLAVQAQAYVRRRMYNKAGFFREGIRGFWLKTLPFYLGKEKPFSWWSTVGLFFRILTAIGAAFMPVLTRRAFMVGLHATDPRSIHPSQLLGALSGVDYLLAAGGLAFIGIPKLIETIRRRSKDTPQSPYSELSAAIEKMPAVPGNGEDVVPLTHALNALRIEMAELIGERSHERLTDVTLLQYCDPRGDRMQVTARTAVNEPTRRPKSARLFLANYVAKEGRWFAENDFLSAKNPFKPLRLTVQGIQRVDYRSVLYLPILTVQKPAALDDGQADGGYVDCCIGVICVHSKRPFRFWRWGDHQKEAGGGSGNVAYERALPYIALITKLVDATAHRVQLETT